MASANQRDSYYRRIYGITLKQYNKILKDQGGVCAVCKLPPTTRAHAVDHDHKTGEIFGLLCFRCNHILIGKIRNSELFRNAADYLAKGLNLFVPERKKKKKRRRK